MGIVVQKRKETRVVLMTSGVCIMARSHIGQSSCIPDDCK